jgi:hypothetical protein
MRTLKLDLIYCVQVPLFSHLLQYEKENSVTRDLPVVGGNLHPAIIELGIQVYNILCIDTPQKVTTRI